MAAEKRQLGKTGKEITPIGLGCWQFSGNKGIFKWTWWVSPAQEEINRMVKAALDGGINWFDTAELYGFGASEKALATALKAAGKTDGDLVIATKWRPFLRTAANITRSIDKRRSCLDPCKIDLYQIHMPYSFSSIEAQMDALAVLVKEGKIGAAGVSNFSLPQMKRAHAALAKHGIPLASNQVWFNLIHRDIEKNGVLQAARETNVTIIAYEPLEGGLLTGKFHKNPEMVNNIPFVRRTRLKPKIEKTRSLITLLEDIARSYSCTAAEVALSWTVNFHGESVVAIPGATKLDHVIQDARALKLKLTRQEMQKLDELSRSIPV